jgi:hypothetical protein
VEAILVLVAVAWVLLTAAAVATTTWHVTAWRRVRKERVLVALDNGVQVTGILWQQRGRLLVLRNFTLLGPTGQGTPADGELVVERDHVTWIQVLS